jgi:hypothetical protein
MAGHATVQRAVALGNAHCGVRLAKLAAGSGQVMAAGITDPAHLVCCWQR